MHYMAEIIVLADLCQFQSADIQIVFAGVVLFNHLLPGCIQNSIHIIDTHICDLVNENLNINHHALKVFVQRHFAQQTVI